MVGLGETDDEILQVMRDMRAHDIDMLTIGQYLAPSGHHLPVRRYVHPDTFRMFEREAAGDGLHARRRRRAGALELPRRPAGARGRRRRALVAGRARPAARGRRRALALRQLPPADAAPGAAGPLRPAASSSTSARGCDLVWFDGIETARLTGAGAARADRRRWRAAQRAAARDAARRRALPALRRRAEDGPQPVALGPLVAARVPSAGTARTRSFAQFLQEKGLLRPMSRDRPRQAAARRAAGSTASTAARAIGKDDERCPYCRSMPSLLDVARLARALDPARARSSRLPCTAPRRSQRRAAVRGLRRARCRRARRSAARSAARRSRSPSLRRGARRRSRRSRRRCAPHAEQPSPQVVKRRLDALDADLPRRREWVAPDGGRGRRAARPRQSARPTGRRSCAAARTGPRRR